MNTLEYIIAWITKWLIFFYVFTAGIGPAIPGSLTRAVWLETFGVAWDGDKETLGANALQGWLFNLLNGKPLAKRHPKSLSGFPTSEVTITNIGDITLDNARDNLRFYDPGLFPGVFGEKPKNVFNMED